jgi:Ca-activated chloride channel family protein
MNFANPWMLCTLLLPLGAAWIVRRTRQHSKPLPAVGRVSISTDNQVHVAAPRKVAPAYLVMAAVALGLIAIARPQWGEREEVSFSQSREVMIALDLSRSMWTEDMPSQISRLRAAKTMVGELLDNMRAEDAGLIVFAGTSFVQVPKSPDYQIIREFMPILEPNYMPKGGSDYVRMLDSALEGFGEVNDHDRYLIVLSDGGSTAQGWQNRIPELLRRNIHVVGIGFGTEKGGSIPDQKGGQLLDRNKNPIVSALTAETLQTLADRTEGRYVAAMALPDSAAVRKLIQSTVESGRSGRVSSINPEVGVDRFQWLLAPAVLLSLLSLAREFQRHPRPRRVHPTTAVLLALLLCLSAVPRAHARQNAEAGLEVKQAFTGDPAQRVRAIASHMAKFGYDAFDLQLLVEASMKYATDERSHGRLPLQGVMGDAIDAAHVGKGLDPTKAPWDRYEAQILALLTPLPVDVQDKEPDKPQDEDDEEDEQNYKAQPLRKAKDKQGKDLYGKNTKSRSEFALGDLSGDENFMPQEPHGPRHRPHKPEQKLASSQIANPSDDPMLTAAHKNMATVVKADSPGRVHQLLAGEAKQTAVEQDY